MSKIAVLHARIKEAAWEPRPGCRVAVAIVQADDSLLQILPLESPYGDGYERRWVPASSITLLEVRP
ncbi:hypothetical protein [Gloeobacter kilaueensis]|uniref:Uncharacterized protein n=1 Tax=Gloeobacter kilaueensis (strain ATCC BAA-2537 / CCAP 1431/1 / ULC 316 / JS1) TaxID=1183438 RepID=U5QDX6_GLOK1|nr:hypothetical protein [Gloeobacter kilaueensis]AGY57121.1 hypothetical protein GKIL_0875 [Gloeobacter kilaueensis JS1]